EITMCSMVVLHFMQIGDVIDNAFRVERIHSTDGGMGVVLLVRNIQKDIGLLALKYCKSDDEEMIKRFQREARLMREFTGNQKVVQLIHAGLDHDPPYIVMPFYADGDLQSLATHLQSDSAAQEKIFLQMAECVHELHSKGTFHRDIKPQNFLRSGNSLVISDFGLSMELDSRTQFTRSSQWWGTQGFMPPEFRNPGGFKNARVESDIFMLGRSYYALLTGLDPTYIDSSLLPPALAVVIERCGEVNPDRRFQSIPQLCQSLVSAYDVLLGRHDPTSSSAFLLDEIHQKLEATSGYSGDRVRKFMESFCMLNRTDAWAIIQKLERVEFEVFSKPEFRHFLTPFLSLYDDAVMHEPGGYGYAEVVAAMMSAIFRNSEDAVHRAKAFEIGVRMAKRMNRYAAMDTCTKMLTSVQTDDIVGAHLAAVVTLHPEEFLKNIELVNVRHQQIRSAILQAKKHDEAQAVEEERS
ncbi:MAG: serine/threonine-protein kinase, partial [Fimbriimonadaceae bacterium]